MMEYNDQQAYGRRIPRAGGFYAAPAGRQGIEASPLQASPPSRLPAVLKGHRTADD
jgi:hypothetical protein